MRYILFFVVTVFICCAAVDLGNLIDAPGSAGMNSRMDVDQVGINESRYTQNGDISEHPGKITKRHGFSFYGDNNAQTFGVYGYKNLKNNYENVIGVVAEIDSVLIMELDSAWYVFDNDTFSVAMKEVSVSDDGGSGVQDSIIASSFLAGSDIDFCDFFGNLIISDGYSIPYVYAPEFGSRTYPEYLHEPDTPYYRPHVVSIGLEAPGQARVGVVQNSGDGLTGLYRYAYKWNLGGATNYTSIPSRWVELNDELSYVTLFESFPNGDTSTITDNVELWRQKEGYPWYAIDTLNYYPTAQVVYIDTTADNAGTLKGITPAALYDIERVVPAGRKTPGALTVFGDIYDTLHVDSVSGILRVANDSVYYVAYSYYNPILDIESPLGPIVYTVPSDSSVYGDSDSISMTGLTKSYTRELERAQWIRVYRSKNISKNASGVPITAPNDAVMYCMYELRANQCYPFDSTVYEYVVFPGWISDDSLALGVEAMVYSADTLFVRNDFPVDIDGGIIIRPPFVNQCEIPFSDIEYANWRGWGIGDPLYPTRLYYSEYDNYYDWSPISYFSLGENRGEELVALAKLPYGDGEVLLAFEHNSVYLIAGEDVEFDASIINLTRKCGAISRRAVMSTEDEIFFMSPNMKIYSTTGGTPKAISNMIENYIDSIFTNYDSAKLNLRTFRTANRVIFFEKNQKKGLAFDLLSRTWQVETYYGKMIPEGSFLHDTTAIAGYDELDWWIWQSGLDTVAGPIYRGKKFIKELASQGVDTYNNGATSVEYQYPFYYQSPFYGDGEWYYEIQQLQFTAKGDSGKYCYLTIYNENEDSLLVDSVAFFSDVLTAPEMRDYRTAFASHEGKRLSIRFWSKDSGTATDVFEISDVKIDLRKKAKNAIN